MSTFIKITIAIKSMLQKEQVLAVAKEQRVTTVPSMADAHCHLDLLDADGISNAIKGGVQLMVTDGVDTKSNLASLKLADRINIFAALGVDPEHAAISDEELEFNITLVRSNKAAIVAIGEIGLDRKLATSEAGMKRQRQVFGKFLDLAVSLNMPVSVHARNAIDEVLQLLADKGVQKAHLHFFEGDVEQAKRAERLGYMISIPPFRSSRRDRVIKDIAIDNILAESDAPAAGTTPLDVKKSIGIVAAAKGISFEKAAEVLFYNTRRFFGIDAGFMRH
ncbi:MAG: TatD family hydrolase [Candidatus Micrarchaeia archaeon]